MRFAKFLKSLHRKEDGGALVEAALTLPTLFIMVLGAVEFSRVAYTSLEVVSAAKAGVAYGAESGATTSDTAGITYAAQNDAGNLAGLTVSQPTSSYACSGSQTVDTTQPLNTQCSLSHIEQTLTVQTQVTMDPLVHVPGLPTQYTLNGQASQVCLQ
jgi:Flp pilus assembly protein TadG